MQVEETQLANVVVSVDVPRTHEDLSLITGLLDLLQQHRAAALWSFEFVKTGASVERIQAGAVGHEFGLLATGDWAGPSARRTRFSDEFATRADQAKRLGITLTALSLEAIEAPEHFDLLVKHQIPLLRTRADTVSGATSSLQPRMARFGIWQAEPTLVVPVVSRWSLPWTARRLLQQACHRAQTLHIAVATSLLARNPPAGLATLDYLLKLSNVRREREQLEFLTLGQLLQLHLLRHEPRRARSILHAA